MSIILINFQHAAISSNCISFNLNPLKMYTKIKWANQIKQKISKLAHMF